MYKCVEQQNKNEDIGEYTSYGIALDDNIILNDVTSDRKFADSIVEQLNKFQASPVHINEIVEDMIVQQYI